VVIVDAGGGTIDVSTYKRVEKESKRTIAEIAAPQCKFKPLFQIPSLPLSRLFSGARLLSPRE
jgi:hypothetical protein